MYRVAAAKPRRAVKQATDVDEARPGRGTVVNAVTEGVQYFLDAGGRDGVHSSLIAPAAEIGRAVERSLDVDETGYGGRRVSRPAVRSKAVEDLLDAVRRDD